MQLRASFCRGMRRRAQLSGEFLASRLPFFEAVPTGRASWTALHQVSSDKVRLAALLSRSHCANRAKHVKRRRLVIMHGIRPSTFEHLHLLAATCRKISTAAFDRAAVQAPVRNPAPQNSTGSPLGMAAHLWVPLCPRCGAGPRATAPAAPPLRAAVALQPQRPAQMAAAALQLQELRRRPVPHRGKILNSYLLMNEMQGTLWWHVQNLYSGAALRKHRRRPPAAVKASPPCAILGNPSITRRTMCNARQRLYSVRLRLHAQLHRTSSR